jgi:glutamate-ammonia-ligase adenylyltransferase
MPTSIPQPPPESTVAEAIAARQAVLQRQSPVAHRFLQRYPTAAADLASLPPVRTVDAWTSWLVGALLAEPPVDAPLRALQAALEAALASPPPPPIADRLRLARRHAYLAIIARELETADPLATGRDVAGLAAACLEVALVVAGAELAQRHGRPLKADGTPCRAVVMGLGKLGGDELNLSSDIDVIYVYETDHGQTDGGERGNSLDLHSYFSRLFQRVTQLLHEQTEHGFVFRVDLDLRPEGRTGTICNSMDALEGYYETFGHAWERLAWIKARPVAGDRGLGDEVIRALQPFVFRRSLDPGLRHEIAAMKRRIDANAARTTRREGFDVKLGHGGIREIEFTVQTLQLVWGGRLPELRATGTVAALARVAAAGLMEQAEAQGLVAAYRFLRHVEHALQWGEERQTQWLPAEGPERDRVRDALGLDDGAFEAVLAEHRQRVRAAFEAIVEGIAPPATDDATEAALALLFEADPAVAAPKARVAAATSLGFEAGEAAVRCIDTLMRRPQSPFHFRVRARGDAVGGLARRVLLASVASAAPDGCLRHFEGFFRVIEHRQQALVQLAEDPQRLRVLANLFGTSHALSHLLIRSPGLIDRLVLDGHEPASRDRASMKALVAEEIALHGGDWEGTLAAVRRVHAAETLRIGFFDLAGLLDTPQVTAQLSLLAEVIVEAVHAAAREDVEARHGVPLADVGIIACGKLAGGELGYRSDLDLIFVHGDAVEPHLATRLARAIITGLSCATPEGVLYDIDTRLRPSGNQGPLCISRARFAAYHAEEAATWEKQAALRMRAIVGPSEVKDLVTSVRAGAIGALADAPERAAREVRDMLERLGQTASHDDIKLGRGGIVTAEFIVQFLQLTLRGDAAAAARTGEDAGSPAVTTALGGLEAAGAFGDGHEPGLGLRIAEAWSFLRRLENRLAVVQERPGESLRLLADPAASTDPGGAAALRRLSQRVGYGDAGPADAADPTAPALALGADYRRHRATLAEAADTILGRHQHGH